METIPVILVLTICFVFLISETTSCQARFNQNSNPELDFQPKASDGGNLIWYKPFQTTQYWQNKLDTFLKPYLNNETSENIARCTSNELPPKGKACEFKIDHSFLPCHPTTGYGFTDSKSGPCIFLKLNKVFKWVPQFYNSTNLPENMPSFLKHYVGLNEGQAPKIWVSCEGETAVDIENMGAVWYLPSAGFPGRYFPASNVEGYLSPLIAVHFERPARGVLISVVCTAWAPNIIRDRTNDLGILRFDIMID